MIKMEFLFQKLELIKVNSKTVKRMEWEDFNLLTNINTLELIKII